MTRTGPRPGGPRTPGSPGEPRTSDAPGAPGTPGSSGDPGAAGEGDGPGTSQEVTLDDVRAAAARIAGSVERTPSAHSQVLSELLGTDVVVKFENLQFTASFKERGALNRLLTLTDDERACGVVAMSAGNHAQAVARHAARLGVDATIVMPATTPFVKVQRTRALGARVVLHGDDLSAATAEAERIVAEEGRTFVHPFDDPAVVAGQGTVALELLADHPDLDALVLPVGGGGLLAGAAVAGRALRDDLLLVGVQAERWSAVADALSGTGPGAGGPTLADGIAVAHPGRLTTRLIAALADEVVTVREESIEDAVNLLLEIEKVVVEGAGAAGIAALREHPERFRGRRVGVVLSGGNVDPRLLASIVMRGLVRGGRLARLQVQVPDVPGTLGKVTTVVGEAGGNIVEVVHQRMFLDVPARSAELEVVLETYGNDHLDRVVAALEGAGFAVRRGDVTFGPR
ncbi:MAG: threonine ammonia-lyase [Acidimicrobiia bacterium]